MGPRSDGDDQEPLVSSTRRTPGMKRSRSTIDPGRLVVIEPYVVLYLIAGFPLESIYSQYIYRKVGRDMGVDVDNLTSTSINSSGHCDTDLNDTAYVQREEVQAATAQWTLYIQLAGFVPSILAYIVYGSCSDRLGRKLCFVLPPIGTLLRSIIQAAAIYFDLPVWVFFFKNIDYFFGGGSLVLIGTFAYISDTTEQKYLALRMTIVDMLVLVTGGASDLAIGYWINASGYFWPMLLVAGGKLLALLYAIFLIPETIAGASSAKKKLELADLVRSFKLFIFDNGTGRRWKMILLFSSLLISSIIQTSSVFTLVEMNAPLCWDSILIGIFAAVALAFKGFGGMIGASMKWCMAEEWIIILSLLSTAAELFYIPLVVTTVMMFFTGPIGMLNVVSIPMTRTILSSYVGDLEQGALYAAMTTMSSVFSMGGQVITNNLYSATIFFIQGRVVFIVAGGLSVLSALVVLIFALMTKEDRIARLSKEKIYKNGYTGIPESEETYGSINA